MFEPDQYQLLDFGGGEKVERFGDLVVRRQTPSVPRTGKISVHTSDLRFRRETQDGHWEGETSGTWTIRHGSTVFGLRPLPSGQIGVFPEQAENWDWIADRAAHLEGLNAINLFAYTGGTTMALAQAGAAVTHVDAAKSVVRQAKQNSELSGLTNAPIRWITEDAMRFVEREIKRGTKYQIVVADPPSFGRGPRGETWKLEKDLPLLLDLLAELTGSQPKMIMVSCHTPGFDPQRIGRSIASAFGLQYEKIECTSMELVTLDGRRLPSGDVARWSF